MTKRIALTIAREVFLGTALSLCLIALLMVAKGDESYLLRFLFSTIFLVTAVFRHSTYTSWKKLGLIILPIIALEFIWFSLTSGLVLTLGQVLLYGLAQASLGLLLPLGLRTNS
ncbi:hypothetical protein ACVRZR_08910 [Streptococcus entericus]|uniref:hypothetical protein n=1 Tax=Streptococcus entericus TaxID=155680 RepID=UPI000364C4EA|nr:hypothetical protein [Streptococcus entericus]